MASRSLRECPSACSSAMLQPERVTGFEFDVGNLTHLVGKHGIEAEDVLEVFANDPVFVEDSEGQTGDWYMIAPVAGGWRTVVVTESRSGDPCIARPITGWPSKKWEIEAYESNP